MEIVRQPQKLKEYIEQYKISEIFETEVLHFRLFHYEKGEFLASPLKQTKDILFLVDGSVQIYGIGSGTGFSPITVAYVPTIFGDLEFATGKPSLFYAEAQNDVYCLALSLSQYEEQLHRDIHFLNKILLSVGNKLALFSSMETSGNTLEERLNYYMDHFCENGLLCGINNAMLQLHCSRRQLQRILAKMCKNGKVQKLKKGIYQKI